MALQTCPIHSGMPPGMLCRAVHELCSCLTPLLEQGDLLNLDMLDVVMKDFMTPAPEESASSPEGPVSVSAPSELTTSQPEEAALPEELALVPRRRLPLPPWFTLSWANESGSPPPKQVNWPLSIPLGAQLDFASLESLQVTISHYPVTGEVTVPYHCPNVLDPDIHVTGPAQTPRSTQFLSTDRGALSECNALYLSHKQLIHC